MSALILSGLILLSSLFVPLTEKINEKLHEGTIPTSVAEAEEPPPFGLDISSAYAGDIEGEPIIEYKENKDWPIASLTKVMAALTFVDQNPDLNKLVALEKDDFVGGATLKVPVGTKISAIDLLHSSLMSSANNSTNALIRGTSLSRDEFIKKMNEDAEIMGLKHTHFVEPTGLDPANRSTPKEYAKIIAVALDNPLIAEVMQKTYYEITPKNFSSFPIGSTDKLLKSPQEFEVVGGKTGFTDGSDYNFATRIKKDDKDVIVVVFGDKTMDGAFESSKK